MERLCAAIPCLAHMAGAVPWDPLLLAWRWGTASSGERAAIQFALSVWDPEWSPCAVPPFTLADFAHLDEPGQAAVAAWFAEPFWP